MKILAKERLLARQLPEELKKGIDSYAIKRLAQLGIDFNSTPFEEVPKSKALRLLKSYYDELGYNSGALVCICPDYARKYIAVIIHYGSGKVKTNIDYYSVSRAINDAIKIYFFKPAQQDKSLIEKLKNRESYYNYNYNKGRINLDGLDSIDNYDKSGYRKNDLDELRKSIKYAASFRAKRILSSALTIFSSNIVYALDALVKANGGNNVSQRLSVLGKALIEADNILQKTFKALGYRSKASDILNQLENIVNQSNPSFELSSFLYKLDTKKFEQEFKKQIGNSISKAF